MRTRTLLATATFALALVSGCGGGKPAGPAAVSGKVSYRGRPVTSGIVVFVPDPERGGSGDLARGDIQADGSYSLKSGTTPGAVAGWHKVTITSVEDVRPMPRSLLPAKYQDPHLSGLSCEVKPGQDNTIHFNLE